MPYSQWLYKMFNVNVQVIMHYAIKASSIWWYISDKYSFVCGNDF